MRVRVCVCGARELRVDTGSVHNTKQVACTARCGVYEGTRARAGPTVGKQPPRVWCVALDYCYHCDYSRGNCGRCTQWGCRAKQCHAGDSTGAHASKAQGENTSKASARGYPERSRSCAVASGC